MKKVLIGVIMLIPILVIGSVLLAAQVVSVEAYIGVDEVVLSETNVEIDGISAEPYTLTAEVFPTMARNKAVEWFIEDGSVIQFDNRFEGTPCEVIDGKVYVYTYCSFTVVAKSVEGAKMARCNFYVAGNVIEGIDIDEGAVSVQTGEVKQLNAILRPTNAIVKNIIEWNSSDEDVVAVDGNGIITAKSVGTAAVSVAYNNGTAVLHDTLTVTVSAGPFKYAEVYTTTDTVSVSSIAWGTVPAGSGYSISGDVLTLSENTAVIASGDSSMTINRQSTGDIRFENYGLINGSYAVMGKIKLRLKAVRADTFDATALSGVVYSSSDQSVATIDANGVVTAISAGEVVFTAQSGGKTATITIEVVKPVTYFRLKDNASIDKRGIAQTTVYGAESFVDSTFTRVRERLFSVGYPIGISNDEFIWSSSHPEIADFDEDVSGLLRYADNIEGEHEITITVTARFSTYPTQTVRESYTYTLLGNGINCITFQQMCIATRYLEKDIALHTTVDLQNEGKNVDINIGGSNYHIDDRLYLKRALYGNGYRIERLDTENFGNDYILLVVNNNDIKISNVTLRCDTPGVNPTISELNQEGECIQFRASDYANRLTGVVVEYSIMEFCKFGMTVYQTDATIKGCIFRNTSNVSLHMPSHAQNINGIEQNSYDNVTLINSIFGLCPTPVIGMSNFSRLKNEDGSFYRGSELHIEGFLEIYNWQRVSELNLAQDMTGDAAVDKLIRAGIRNLLESKEVEPYRYTYQGDDYFCLGIFIPGALYPSVGKLYHDETIPLYAVEMPLGSNTIYVYTYTKDIGATTPESKYVENEALYARMRADA